MASNPAEILRSLTLSWNCASSSRQASPCADGDPRLESEFISTQKVRVPDRGQVTGNRKKSCRACKHSASPRYGGGGRADAKPHAAHMGVHRSAAAHRARACSSSSMS